jgi:hypothetical protein
MLLINSAEHSTPLNPSPDRLARDHQSNAEEELDRVWMQTYRTAGGPIFPGVQTGSTGIKRQCELNDECICIRNRPDTSILRQPGEWLCAAVLSRAPAVNIWIRRKLKMARLEGKVAFITGAGSGIARAAARLFAT